MLLVKRFLPSWQQSLRPAANLIRAKPQVFATAHFSTLKALASSSRMTFSTSTASSNSNALTKYTNSEEEKERQDEQRQAYEEMMGKHILTALEINELANVYFKLVDNNEQVNWDDFDLILQQILSYSMMNEMPM